ncbi:MAG TPA: glycoside hydrolase family 2, partial [Puia sp.]
MKYAGTVLLIFFFCWKLSAQQTISLAGQWNVKYGQASDAQVHLPGTLDDAGIGDPPTLTDAKLTREVLLHLTRKHTYIGPASYERVVDIPRDWAGQSITLE